MGERADSEEPHRLVTINDVLDKLPAHIVTCFRVHISNSAGIISLSGISTDSINIVTFLDVNSNTNNTLGGSNSVRMGRRRRRRR